MWDGWVRGANLRRWTASAPPARRSARALLGAVLVGVVAGACGEGTARTIPGITVVRVADSGPPVQGPFVASTDLSDLGAMVAAANRQDCGALGCFPRASGPAAPSLLLAVPIEIPCNTVTGIDAAMTRSAAADGVAEVTITAHSRPRSCGDAGALSLPPPLASLVAIPVSGLPASELVVHLQHDGASPRELGGAVVYGETVVDLRPPPTPMPAPAVRKAQALAAIAFAEDDAKRRVPEATDKPVLVLLGTTRWAGPDLDCEGKPARHGTAFAGYVVMVQLEGHLLEYHSARGATRYCGGKELPGHQMGGTTGGMGDGM